MAKKPRPSGRLLSFLQRIAGDPPPPISQSALGTDKEQSISGRERDAIIGRITEATRSPTAHRGDSYSKYIRPMSRQIAQNRLDAKAIEALAPEVKTAKEIVIPSIISPTDMRDGNITITSTSSLATKDQNDDISKILDYHFNDTLKLSTRLPDWIHEGLYGAGAKAILVLPVTEIDTIINDPTKILSKTKVYAGTERLDLQVADRLKTAVDLVEKTSIFGVVDSGAAAADAFLGTALEMLRPGVESAVEAHFNELPPVPGAKDATRSYDRSKAWSSTTQTQLRTFATGVVEGLNIVDNPDTLKLDRARKSTKAAEITSRMVNVYKTTSLITVNSETKPSVDNPIVLELPPESVIPIFTPGTPSDHIGYFILLDEFGNPLRIADEGQIPDSADNRTTSPGALYKSFGFDDNSKGGRMNSEQSALMSNVYQTIVDAHLKSRLKSCGFSSIYIGANSSVYRCMFARYLAARKTKLLFVPRDLMSYLCFRYNDDGTGRSKIEDIKFILSLKITLLISRVMASMNSAINRKKININFTENMGDPIAFMQSVEKEVIDKNMTAFSYDPTEITRTLAQKALTVVPKGIPGLENFEVSTEPNQSNDIRPDDGLMDDLNNMMILNLDVPPSAYNQLGENEFSRSVATNDLFFSRRISAYQRPVCEHAARHVQIYTHMSGPLKESIRKILRGPDGDKTETSTEEGTADDAKVSLEDKLADVIRSIEATLPAPNIAPNKTEFEELDSIIASLSTALEAVFDNDLGAIDENPIAHLRSLVKSDLVRAYMTKIGASRDVVIPDLSDPAFMQRVAMSRLNITNFAAMLKQTAEQTKPGDAPEGGQPF